MDACQIVFYIILFYIRRTECVKFGVCSKEKSVIVSGQTVFRTLYFCCRHYEESSGECKECDTGYESNGTRCEPCKTGQYGIICADTCHCKAYESCDHIRGCIQKSTNQQVTMEHITPITEKTVKDPNDKNEGLLNKERSVYVGSSGLLVFVICILMAYICYIKCNRKAESNTPKQNPIELATEETFQVHGMNDAMNTNENNYDEIDERYLFDITLAVNPGKYIIEKEKNPQGENMHSKNEISHNDSSINPDQPVISSAVHVHFYSSTDEGDNSEDNYRDSGYLHPYQPLILSMDTENLKHDYTECRDLDIVESKATPNTKGLKQDYTECKDLDIVEAPASNIKDVVVKEEVKAEIQHHFPFKQENETDCLMNKNT